MAKVRFRFAEADRPTYGDKWYEVDPNDIEDPRFTAGLIERWEDATGYTLMVTLGAGLMRGEHRAVRALMWLGVIADGVEVEWADFWPNVRAAEMQRGDQGNRTSPTDSRATGGTGRSTGRRSASTSTTTS